MSRRRAVVGVVDDNAGAVLVTVSVQGALIDRRHVDLIDGDLPRHPHHHEGQRLPRGEAVALVERVATSASRCSKASLDALVASLPDQILAVSIRKLPELPPTIAERIADYRAQNVADSAMYRLALADAAKSRGWRVEYYDKRTVMAQAALVLGVEDIVAHFKGIARSAGKPWRRDHQVAMAAALVACAPSGKVSDEGRLEANLARLPVGPPN